MIRSALRPALLAVPVVAWTGSQRAVPCDPDNAGITVPAGFCVTRFADSLQLPRHMVVAPNGDLLIVGNARGGRGGQGSPGSLFLLRDADGDGRAELVTRLAQASGSGIALANGYLYSSSGRSIVRYRYEAGQTTLGPADTIIRDLPTGGHAANNFLVVGSTLYLNIGSRSNACEPGPRAPQTPGADPCVELETRAGIWSFDANRTDQTPADGVRFATGIRNAIALTTDPRDGTLWATMHGRDGLQPPPAGLWPDHDNRYGAENPGEQVIHILKGDDFGWPYCYWSMDERALVTAPEYGGDGTKTDRCTDRKPPAYAFPGHWAPNDMLFYTGTQFPAEYRDGAFVAFHGSWNRAPLPNEGFRVSFLPIGDGRVTGAHRDFATDFSLPNQQPGRDGRIHRPAGLAQGTDGSLYVADDFGGTIYRISYTGR
ncbi:MAG: PQQ-dependent sugar dehydrogenase [Gemmatimonadaceae bacterium]|nr:PQQ-dependent sugar dehydrogenase [Gemmatimonadaceae bacterium]